MEKPLPDLKTLYTPTPGTVIPLFVFHISVNERGQTGFLSSFGVGRYGRMREAIERIKTRLKKGPIKSIATTRFYRVP